MKSMACVVALATGAGMTLSAASLPASADVTADAPTGLQLSVASRAGSDGETAVVELSYRGGSPTAVSLFVDGALLNSRALVTAATHGVIRFEIDPSVLSAGEHQVVIEATDLAGSVTTVRTRLNIESALPSGLARFMAPQRSSVVQGIVPIEVQIDPSIQNPYVGFYFDQQLLELANFPPYTYNWDSTRSYNGDPVTNGKHLLSAEVLDHDGAHLFTITVPVVVDNPGGLTRRETSVPDLAHPRSVAASAVHHALAGHAGSTPAGPAALARRDIRSAVSGPPVVHLFAPVLSPKPGAAEMGRMSPGELGMPNREIPPTHFAGVSSGLPGALGAFARPHDLLTVKPEGLEADLKNVVQVGPTRAGNIAILPGYLASPAAQQNQARATAAARSRKAARPDLVGPSASTARGRTLDVAFDSSRIAFDVPPRIEDGMALAPFRQIFEHTGGVVQWFQRSKTVRAFNSTREVQFRVGHKQAKVNNEPLHMEKAPFIDRGRAIVPLSFVRDALNVNVEYDAATGHLRIESKP